MKSTKLIASTTAFSFTFRFIAISFPHRVHTRPGKHGSDIQVSRHCLFPFQRRSQHRPDIDPLTADEVDGISRKQHYIKRIGYQFIAVEGRYCFAGRKDRGL